MDNGKYKRSGDERRRSCAWEWPCRVFDLEHGRLVCNVQTCQSDGSVGLVYKVDFRNLVEERVVSVRGTLTEKLNFVLVDLPYNVQKYQNGAHAAYDEHGLNGTKNIAKVLQYVRKPGTHGPMFSTVLQNFLWYMSLPF